MTIPVKIIGYTPKENGVFAHAISIIPYLPNHFGDKTFCEFITDTHLKKHCVERYELIGIHATYYATTDNGELRKGITLKNN